MSEEDALLDAIAAVPADFLPRLAYADLLEETGREATARFVRAQVEMEGLSPRATILMAMVSTAHNTHTGEHREEVGGYVLPAYEHVRSRTVDAVMRAGGTERFYYGRTVTRWEPQPGAYARVVDVRAEDVNPTDRPDPESERYRALLREVERLAPKPPLRSRRPGAVEPTLWRGGFAYRVDTTLAGWEEYGRDVLARDPVREVDLTGRVWDGDRLRETAGRFPTVSFRALAMVRTTAGRASVRLAGDPHGYREEMVEVGPPRVRLVDK